MLYNTQLSKSFFLLNVLFCYDQHSVCVCVCVCVCACVWEWDKGGGISAGKLLSGRQRTHLCPSSHTHTHTHTHTQTHKHIPSL